MRIDRLIALPVLAFAAQLHAASPAAVSADPTHPGAVITNQVLGASLANWYDITQAGIGASLTGNGFTALRWPGGSASDEFHWQTNSGCNGQYVDSKDTFAAFMNRVVLPQHLDVAVTLNYGSDKACTGGGQPAEAAAWVAYAKAHDFPVSHWTVGNEVYGSWEYDLHAKPNDAATYAAAVVGADGYYALIKKANPAALVGVVAMPGWSPAWDPIVLSQATYDFVEYHWYAQEPGQESDSYLIGKAPQALAAQLRALKVDLAKAKHADTPIYVGELGSVSYDPGKQTSSITQSLFAGQVLGELMNAGVSRATWWLGYGGCADASGGNFSSSLYGWQDFGGYMIFSDGTPEYGCSNAPIVPRGTPLPTARAFALMSLVALNGEHMLPVTMSGATGLRAYAMIHQGGTGFVLFNLAKAASLPVTLSVKGVSTASSVAVDTYDRAIYDKSKNNVWAAPTHVAQGAVTLPFTLTLPPWSMTVVRLAGG